VTSADELGDPRVIGWRNWCDKEGLDCVGIGIDRVATRVGEERFEARHGRMTEERSWSEGG